MEFDLEFKAGNFVSQGDLIGLGDWEDRHPLERYGVIITADCDIQRARADRDLVFLRIVTQRDYIDFMWAREKLERERDRHLTDVTKMINRLRSQSSGASVDLSVCEVDQWIIRSRQGDIQSAIGPLNAEDRRRLDDNLERARRAIAHCADSNGEACMNRYCDLVGRPRADVVRTAAGELSKVRDDLFFISGLTDQDDRKGYYILLDRVSSIRLDQVSDSLAEVRKGEKVAYRFGRLGRQFKYAMVQKFAFLFQRIGLPDRYTKSHADSLTSVDFDC